MVLAVLHLKERLYFFMCLFPLENGDISGVAYRKGIREFDCGACPECLRKRSNVWALRSVYECKAHAFNCMVTLTYDSFKYDNSGNIVGENPVNPDLVVNKRHIQLFIKRLRKWYSKFTDKKIKYLCCAEYGSHTHRAHYHLILFGVKFPDCHFYKKSKRGNVIYMSNTLTKLWSYGICTVDSINVHSGVARYCTKYCAKSRSDKTFMLCSQGIGVDMLLRDFNGLSYIIDGREYPIPRLVWNNYITNKYKKIAPKLSANMSYKYVNKPSGDNWYNDLDSLRAYEDSKAKRIIFRGVRDCDPSYIRYLSYWRSRGEVYENSRPSVLNRIYALDSRKYCHYKTAALHCLSLRKNYVPSPAPGSNCVSQYYHWYYKSVPVIAPRFGHLSLPSRPIKTSDTKNVGFWYNCPFDNEVLILNELIPLTSTFRYDIMLV